MYVYRCNTKWKKSRHMSSSCSIHWDESDGGGPPALKLEISPLPTRGLMMSPSSESSSFSGLLSRQQDVMMA